MKNLAMVLLLALLCGCGLAYEAKKSQLQKTATEADYGPRPPTNHIEFERSLILAGLRDAESARFQEPRAPIKFIMQKGIGSPTPVLVWVSSWLVNAKNAYGGYTGFQIHEFAWRDGKIVAVYSPANGFWLNREFVPPL